jgi:hypothetical protein
MADEPQHPPTIDPDGARLRPLRTADADAFYDYLRSDWAAADARRGVGGEPVTPPTHRTA